ncbi:RNA-binding protein [Sphingomonas sp. ABOLF]|uniref:RNA-binding protein n=1 Tax=Sphingomonas sp. ABOLF TaxID=1985879 RepID=UPI0013DFAE99|nr:RNA-binding protein [Sphingomonas sp. ABOLF]
MSKNGKNDSSHLDLIEQIVGGGVEVGKNGRLHLQDGRDLAAVLLGRRGGLKGGTARAKLLTPEQRRDIAQRAAKARWARKGKDDRGE